MGVIVVGVDDDEKIVALLIGARANLEARDDHGRTALMVAAMSNKGGAQALEALLVAGADVDARDDAGATAPILAVQKFNAEALQKLIARGIDVAQKRGADGKSLMEVAFEEDVSAYAVQGYASNWARCGELLIQAGAKVPSVVRMSVDGADKQVAFAKMIIKNGYKDSAIVFAACEAMELGASTSLPGKKRMLGRRAL